ncbi:MAG: hypothetical protein PHQ75_05835 [Thermoguttaceae bacterium]|nr:hypothetical protein [Thermoguttaceae bacterium]
MPKILEELQNIMRRITRAHPWRSGDLLTNWLETEVNPALRKYGIGLHRMNKFERLSEEEKARIPGTVEWIHRLRQQNIEFDGNITQEEWSRFIHLKSEEFREEVQRHRENPNPIPTRQKMMLYLLSLPEHGVPFIQHMIDLARRAIEYPRNRTFKEFWLDDRNIAYSLFYAERTIDENQKIPLESRICFSTFHDLEFSLPHWIEDNAKGNIRRVYREMNSVLKPCIDDLYRLLDTLKQSPLEDISKD